MLGKAGSWVNGTLSFNIPCTCSCSDDLHSAMAAEACTPAQCGGAAVSKDAVWLGSLLSGAIAHWWAEEGDGRPSNTP